MAMNDQADARKGAGGNGMNILKRLRRAFFGRRPAPCSLSEFNPYADEEAFNVDWCSGMAEHCASCCTTIKDVAYFAYQRGCEYARMKANVRLDRTETAEKEVGHGE